MALSNEAAISLIGVIVNLPAALLIIWKLCPRRRQARVNDAGQAKTLSLSLSLCLSLCVCVCVCVFLSYSLTHKIPLRASRGTDEKRF